MRSKRRTDLVEQIDYEELIKMDQNSRAPIKLPYQTKLKYQFYKLIFLDFFLRSFLINYEIEKTY